MGFLAATSSALFHRTTDGRRVCQLWSLVPARSRPTWLVGDAEVERVRRRFERVQLLTFVIGIPLLVQFVGDLPSNHDAAAGWPLVRPMSILMLPALTSYLAIRLWVMRGLPRLTDEAAVLVPVRWRERSFAQARAMGLPTTRALCAAGLLMTAGQVWIAISDGRWWAYAGSILLGASTVFMAWQVVTLLRERNGRAGVSTGSM